MNKWSLVETLYSYKVFWLKHWILIKFWTNDHLSKHCIYKVLNNWLSLAEKLYLYKVLNTIIDCHLSKHCILIKFWTNEHGNDCFITLIINCRNTVFIKFWRKEQGNDCFVTFPWNLGTGRTAHNRCSFVFALLCRLLGAAEANAAKVIMKLN